MFNCRSCMQRHANVLIGDSISYKLGKRSILLPKNTLRRIESGYSTTSQIRDGKKPRTGELRTNQSNPREKPWKGQHKRLQSGRLLRRGDIEKELMYLGDPLKLADHVSKLLQQDKFDEAEVIVQTASKDFPCTVSWNHLINWQLSQGKVNVAIKTYNQMKKRGQKPDAHTYTILFRGLAEYAHYPESLQKALSIYHSMDAENSPVKPNVIHTNAVLKVCARAKDMDALQGVVAKLRRKGLRAPNNLTYTTMFNAIRQQASEAAAEMKDEAETRAIYHRAIGEARRIWVEVIEQWRHGDIFIDEELTCSVGRILLLGEAQEIDDIFSLIEQTMNIPRLVPRYSTKVKEITDSTGHQLTLSSSEEEQPSAVRDNMTGTLLNDEFMIVRRPKATFKRGDTYVRPGRNSLSMVLEALKSVKLIRPLLAYWDIFTNTHNVLPDGPNFHNYLQNLRIRRASSEAINVLMQMPKHMLEKKSFRIAMSTCARDKNNKNSFTTAGKILDLMEQSLTDLDIPSLQRYMEVATYGQTDYSTQEGKADPKHAWGHRILRALRRLGPCIANVRSAMASKERPPSRKLSKSQPPADDQATALALVREMISAYDKIINMGLVEPDMNKELKLKRSELAAFVTRYNAGPMKVSSQNEKTEGQASRSTRTLQEHNELSNVPRYSGTIMAEA